MTKQSDFFRKVSNWIVGLPQDANLSSTSVRNAFIHDFKLEALDKRYGPALRSFMSYVWDNSMYCSGFMVRNVDNVFLNSTTIYKFENSAFIVRGYPNSHRINNPSFKNQNEMIAQVSYDGILMGFYLFPEGKRFRATNKRIEYADRQSLFNMNYQQIFCEKLPELKDKIQKFLDENPNLLVFGELFGNHKILKGLIDYDREIDWKAFDILDMSTHRFFTWEDSKKMLDEYELPYVETFKIDEFNKYLDKNEGVVFKRYVDGEIEVYKKISSYVQQVEKNPEAYINERVQCAIRQSWEKT